MILLDSDHLSIVINRQSSARSALATRLRSADDFVAVPVICVEEQCKGWLARIHRAREVHDQILGYERLAELFDFFRRWRIQAFETPAADAFNQFRKQKIRIGSQDLKIACIALTADALLLSANLSDFRQVPGLRVENWLLP